MSEGELPHIPNSSLAVGEGLTQSHPAHDGPVWSRVNTRSNAGSQTDRTEEFLIAGPSFQGEGFVKRMAVFLRFLANSAGLALIAKNR
jgi:hypothetical protein